MEYLAPLAVAITFIVVAGAVARNVVVNRRMREIAHVNAELQAKLLDRLGSVDELQAYLASDVGRRFVDAAAGERGSSLTKILGTVQSGIVLLALGVAMDASRGMVGDEVNQALRVFGTIGMFAGTGLLVSAATVYFLSKRWGLLPARETAPVDAA